MTPDADLSASSPRPPPSGRKGSKKVRTGCITCKIRKVKCDEAKPFCMRCTKTGRRCDGYLDAKAMAQRRRRSAGLAAGDPRDSPPAPMALFHDWASADERRAFHFFQHITAPCLSGDLDAAFWRVLVPQICQSEPAVRHAVLAVSSLHEGMVQATATGAHVETEDRSSFALYQYNRAIACLLDQMRTVDARPLVPLLTCVLFVCIELMQSKDKESLLHLEQGRQILNQLGRKPTARNPETDLIRQHLVPMYTRLSLTSLMLGGLPVEIPTPLKTLTEVPIMFSTVDEVRYALYDLMDECLRFAKKSHVAKIGDVSPESEEMRAFEREQDALLRKLAKFNVAFSLFRSTRPRHAPTGFLALMQIHVHTTFIWISTALSRHETVFDDYVDTFAAIVPLASDFIDSLSAPRDSQVHQHAAERPGGPAPTPSAGDARRFSAMFTFDMHIIAPLYFVAAKCRHPIVRRAALDLLARNPRRRENLWRANVMAAIAERTMRLEEKHLSPPPPAGSQPPSQQPSPPEIPALFPGASLHPYPDDSWMTGDLDPLSAETLGLVSFDSPAEPTASARFDRLGAAPVPIRSSGSSSSAAGSANLVGVGDITDHMQIDPTLFFDPTEASTAHSFSVAPSDASSHDERAAPAAASAPPLPRAAAELSSPELWSGVSSQPPPGIAVEPPTPVGGNNSPFMMPPHSHSQRPRSHSPSQRPQPPRSHGSPASAGSEGSPPLPPMGMGVASSPGTATAAVLLNPGVQPRPGIVGGPSRLSPSTGARSMDAPFDVPERFRVHESIIGPEKEDGTSWVMLFRKLGGLDAEWDVLTEYVVVSY